MESAAAAGDEGLPKTVYCLVDVSGSMEGRLEEVKEVLGAVSSGLGDKDELVIGKLGNRTVHSDKLTDKKEMEEQIQKLEPTDEDTDLYTGVMDGIRYLQQEPQIQPLRCLIVFSDGADEQTDGSTWGEAYDMVEKADIPVYTVASVPEEPRAKDKERIKKLGSFARVSAGGLYFPKAEEGLSELEPVPAQDMASEILNSLDLTWDICADLSKTGRPQKDTCVLSVSWKTGGQVYEDTMEVPVKSLKFDDSGKKDPEKEKESIWIISLLLGATVLFLMAWGSLRQIKRRKSLKKQRMQEERREEERKKREQAYQSLPRLDIKMTAVGEKDNIHRIQLVKGQDMTLGRSKNAMILVDPEDKRLSSVHFAMRWDGAGVYIWDMDSSNGTTVNGVAIDKLGRVAVRAGDLVKAGSYEYRVDWKE